MPRSIHFSLNSKEPNRFQKCAYTNDITREESDQYFQLFIQLYYRFKNV